MKLVVGSNLFLVAITVAIASAVNFKLHGIEVHTVADAFVVDSSTTVFSESSGQMSISLAPTPTPWPDEARNIYRSAWLGIPVLVQMDTASGPVSFEIKGLNDRGDYVIPCSAPNQCANILRATNTDIPPRLAGLLRQAHNAKTSSTKSQP